MIPATEMRMKSRGCGNPTCKVGPVVFQVLTMEFYIWGWAYSACACQLCSSEQQKLPGDPPLHRAPARQQLFYKPALHIGPLPFVGRMKYFGNKYDVSFSWGVARKSLFPALSSTAGIPVPQPFFSMRTGCLNLPPV